jgi:outer membrane PBP1 activator LpoA protein
MNKKEQQLVEGLKTKLALKFTEPVNADVLIPVDNKIVNGYTYNSYSMRVEKSCSSALHHNIGQWDKTYSQRPVAQYSSKLLALKAMRNEVEKACAYKLRQIDLMIEEESTVGEIK